MAQCSVGSCLVMMLVNYLPLIFLLVGSTSASYNIIIKLNVNKYDVIHEIHMRTYTECKMRCDKVEGCTLIGMKDGNHGELVCLLLKEKNNKDGGLNASKSNDGNVTVIKEIGDITILKSQVIWTAKPKVNGQWSRWSTTSPCNVSCGGGIIRMRRVCHCPSPSNGGLECPLSNGTRGLEERLVKRCGAKTCPVDGMYGPWSAYGPCNQSCGGGSQLRNRSCDSPPPSHGGRNCTSLGNATEVRECNTDICPCQNILRFVGIWDVSDPTYDDWTIEERIVHCVGFDGCGKLTRYVSDDTNLFPPSKGWFRASNIWTKWLYFRQVKDRLSVVIFNWYYHPGSFYKGKDRYANKAVGKPINGEGGLLGSWKVFFKSKGRNRHKYDIKNDGTLTITTPTQKSFQIKASDNKDGKYSQNDGWCKGYNDDVADKTVIYLRVVDDSVGILEVKEISDNEQMSERFGWK